MLQFPVGTHKWVMDDICEMLEEHPEYENMSDEALEAMIEVVCAVQNTLY